MLIGCPCGEGHCEEFPAPGVHRAAYLGADGEAKVITEMVITHVQLSHEVHDAAKVFKGR